MSEDIDTPGHRADPPADLHDLEAEIERTREDLAWTVDQLTSKLDVKSRIGTPVLAGIGAVLVLAVGAVLWRRHDSSGRSRARRRH